MNIIASPKTRKSWLTLDLAIAVATGRRWLGRYETEPGSVLIIDDELHRETSAHRIPQVARACGVAMREFDERIFVDKQRGRLQDIFTLAPYFAALEPGRFKVIVLDAFYCFMPASGDENDNGTMKSTPGQSHRRNEVNSSRDRQPDSGAEAITSLPTRRRRRRIRRRSHRRPRQIRRRRFRRLRRHHQTSPRPKTRPRPVLPGHPSHR